VHLFFFRRSTAQLHGAFKPVPAHRSQHVHGRCRTLTTASCLTPPPPRPAYPSPPEYVLCTKVEHRSHRQLAVRAHHDWSIYPHLLALPAQHPSLTNINTIVLRTNLRLATLPQHAQEQRYTTHQRIICAYSQKPSNPIGCVHCPSLPTVQTAVDCIMLLSMSWQSSFAN
jgi:hypothetical protein